MSEEQAQKIECLRKQIVESHKKIKKLWVLGNIKEFEKICMLAGQLSRLRKELENIQTNNSPKQRKSKEKSREETMQHTKDSKLF